MSASSVPHPTDKEAAEAVVARQPADASFQSIIRELAYAELVRRGLADCDAGRTISDDELRRRMSLWQK
jgi:predicted transcriptional regulator